MLENALTIQSQPSGAAMEGGGFYNRHSAMQAAGISLLLDDWERAVRDTVIGDGPIVIADYGSSQGRNSMAPMRIAIDELRMRTGADRPIQVVHTDLPSNDFVALFTALADDPSSYLRSTSNVFPSAIGRSYFEPILPADSISLGWNTWTMHWMSGPIIFSSDHVFPGFSQVESVLAEVGKRQSEDWRQFLNCRGKELKPGARMLMAFVGHTPEGTGWNWIGDNFWGSIQDLGSDGVLSEDEQLRMTVPVHGRTIEQIHEPFGAKNSFAGLRIEKADIFAVPDQTWATYQKDRDAELLGVTHANMVRAWSGPTLANVLSARPDKDAAMDKLYARLAERLAANPQVHGGKLARVVLEKM